MRSIKMERALLAVTTHAFDAEMGEAFAVVEAEEGMMGAGPAGFVRVAEAGCAVGCEAFVAGALACDLAGAETDWRSRLSWALAKPEVMMPTRFVSIAMTARRGQSIQRMIGGSSHMPAGWVRFWAVESDLRIPRFEQVGGLRSPAKIFRLSNEFLTARFPKSLSHMANAGRGPCGLEIPVAGL